MLNGNELEGRLDIPQIEQRNVVDILKATAHIDVSPKLRKLADSIWEQNGAETMTLKEACAALIEIST